MRLPEPGLNLNELFLFEAKRKVQKDRTVSLHGVVYEVDAALVGETVTLRFDPSAPPQRPLQVCHLGQVTGLARVVEPYANCFVKRERPSRNLAVEVRIACQLRLTLSECFTAWIPQDGFTEPALTG